MGTGTVKRMRDEKCIHPTLLGLQAVEFSWDPQDTGLDNSLLSCGAVSIQPATGRIGAAESMLFRVSISAECGPRFLGQQAIACLVRQEPPTMVSGCWRLEIRMRFDVLFTQKRKTG